MSHDSTAVPISAQQNNCTVHVPLQRPRVSFNSVFERFGILKHSNRVKRCDWRCQARHRRGALMRGRCWHATRASDGRGSPALAQGSPVMARLSLSSCAGAWAAERAIVARISLKNDCALSVGSAPEGWDGPLCSRAACEMAPW